MASVTVNWYRDTSKDIVSKSTLYTDSTTLVEGAILYNNLGEDSGIKVGTVNSDGSFEVESMVTITLDASNTTKSSSGTINDIAFTFGSDGVVEPSQIVVKKGELCTVSVANSTAKIYLDGELLTSDGLTSFTPTKDCTLEFVVSFSAPEHS